MMAAQPGTPAADPAQGDERPGALFVLPWVPDDAGGVNRVVLGLLEGFSQSLSYRPLLLVNIYPQRRVVRRRYAGLPEFFEYYLPAPFDERRKLRSFLAWLVRLPMTLGRFIALIRRERVVIVNLHYPDRFAFTVLLARFLMAGGFRVILSFHGADLPRERGAGWAQRLLWRCILRLADGHVACSESLAEELRRIAPVGASVHAVHNAVDPVACGREARQFQPPPGLDGRRYVLSVGTFEHKKAHDVLIESFERIAPAHPDLSLVVIGRDGPTRAACEGRAAASPYRDRILLFGNLPHGPTMAAIAGSTLFALPSRREPFGLVLLEAAALARPVVASRVGGIPEIIEDGQSGILVPPDDVAALAGAMNRLLTDRELADAQARRLQGNAARSFTLAHQVQAYAGLFDAARSLVPVGCGDIGTGHDARPNRT